MLHVQVKTINCGERRSRQRIPAAVRFRTFPQAPTEMLRRGKYLAWSFTRLLGQAKLNRTYDDYGREGGGGDASVQYDRKSQASTDIPDTLSACRLVLHYKVR